MGTMTVTVQSRPIKIGWCVRRESLDDFRTALRLTHTLWGGRFNPLIPIDDHDLADDIVRLFGVDLLYPVSQVQPVTDFIKRYHHLPWSIGPVKVFFDNCTNFADISHPLKMIREENATRDSKRSEFFVPNWRSDDPLEDVLLAQFGGYPSLDEIGIDYSKMVTSHINAKPLKIDSRTTFQKQFLRAYFPRDITGAHLKNTRSPTRECDGIFIGSANSWKDLLEYWNIRATGVFLAFYDPRFGKRLGPSVKALLQLFQSASLPSNGSKERISAWLSEGHSVPKDFGQNFLCQDIDQHTWNGLNLQACVPIWRFSNLVANIDSDGKDSILKIPLSQIQLNYSTHHSMHHVAFDLSTERNYRANCDSTFWFPSIPEMNREIGKLAFWRDDMCRLLDGRLSTILPLYSRDLVLRAVPVHEVIAVMFQVFGMNATSSGAGLVCRRLIKQMGGLQGCRIFKIGGVRGLIANYSPLSDFSIDEALDRIRIGFDKYESLYLEPRDTLRLEAKDAFSYLIKRGVFRPGRKLKCPDCLIRFWVALDDIRTEVICELCGHKFNAVSQFIEDIWRYRRSGLFGRDDQQGGPAVAATLQYLESALSSMEPLLYATGMEISPAGANIRKCETDFVLVSDTSSRWRMEDTGRVKLAIGECKTNRQISEDDVENLRKVADSFPRDKVDVYLVFAKLGEFSKTELRRCYKAQCENRSRIILLSSEQLEDTSFQKILTLSELALESLTWHPPPEHNRPIGTDEPKPPEQ